MDKIYVLKKDKIIKGPYTIKELKAKGVRENDSIWYEGLKDWTSIKDLPHLHEALLIEEDTTKAKKNFLANLFPFFKRKS